MIGKFVSKPQIRFMLDAALGFGVFCGLTVALLGPSSAACLIPLGLQAAGSLVGAKSTLPVLLSAKPALLPGGANDAHIVLAILATAFSTLFALNLTFVRHLTAAYRRANRPVKPGQRSRKG